MPAPKTRLHEMYPGRTALSPGEAASCCLELSQPHAFRLCVADPLPFSVRVREHQVAVVRDDLAAYLDSSLCDETRANELTSSAGSTNDKVVAALFRAEFRAEVYRIQLLWTGRQVVDLIDSFQVDPEAVDERCLAGIQMAKLIHEVEAKVVLTKIHDLLASTTSLPTDAYPGMGPVTAQTEAVELCRSCPPPREP